MSRETRCLLKASCKAGSALSFLVYRSPIKTGDLTGHMVDGLRGIDDAIMLLRGGVH